MSSLREEYVKLFTSAAAFLAVFSGTIVFTPKDAFLTRLSAVVALFAINWAVYLSMSVLIPTTAMVGALTTVLWCACLSAGEVIFISRAAPEDLTKGNKKASTITLLYRAVCLYFNFRRAGTKWEIRDLSYNCPRSRAGFLAYKLCCMAIAFLVIDVTASAPPPESHMVTTDKQTMWNFGVLNSEDVVFRLLATTMMWVTGYAYKYLINTSGAAISVGLGLSKPEAWPRLFNAPFSSLTSVRGFWSIFWHQTFRKYLAGWGDAISDNTLCLRRGTLLSRYTRLLLAFAISGVLHHAVDAAWEIPHVEGVSLVFFSMQALGIMIEDAVQTTTKNWGIPQRAKSVVGFFWLWAFLWWTTPRWFYGTIRSPIAGDPFPFSVVKPYMTQ